jgi:hypothetical protein
MKILNLMTLGEGWGEVELFSPLGKIKRGSDLVLLSADRISKVNNCIGL